MEPLESELKELIVETLALEDIEPASIDPEQPLFGAGLGLDSIDALELGIVLQKRYGVKIDATDAGTRTHFASVRNLASFVASHRQS